VCERSSCFWRNIIFVFPSNTFRWLYHAHGHDNRRYSWKRLSLMRQIRPTFQNKYCVHITLPVLQKSVENKTTFSSNEWNIKGKIVQFVLIKSGYTHNGENVNRRYETGGQPSESIGESHYLHGTAGCDFVKTPEVKDGDHATGDLFVFYKLRGSRSKRRNMRYFGWPVSMKFVSYMVSKNVLPLPFRNLPTARTCKGQFVNCQAHFVPRPERYCHRGHKVLNWPSMQG
jgi:hypothetical protein